MKKLFASLIITVILAILPIFPVSAAKAQSLPFYAQVLSGCVLYSDRELTNAITSLPPTYFVCVTEQDESVLRVTYKNVDGYARREYLSPCDFIPKYKFAESYLSLSNDGGTVNVRLKPDHTADNVCSRLTDGTKLYYYGFVEGSEQNKMIGSRWYCVDLGEGKRGYVYSMYAVVPALPDNVVEPEEQPVVAPVYNEAHVSAYGEYVVVAALCIPVILLMYLLFKHTPSSPD